MAYSPDLAGYLKQQRQQRLSPSSGQQGQKGYYRDFGADNRPANAPQTPTTSVQPQHSPQFTDYQANLYPPFTMAQANPGAQYQSYQQSMMGMPQRGPLAGYQTMDDQFRLQKLQGNMNRFGGQY